MRGEVIRYFGAYCPQHGVWLRKQDYSLVYYESPELIAADLSSPLGVPGVSFYRPHLYEVTEFGKEQRVDSNTLPPGSALCVGE